MGDNKGFTIVELLIVMVIIALLSSIALNSYISYRKKARLTAIALPYAEDCTRQAIEYCLELKPSSSVNIDISSLSLPSCQNKSLGLYNTSIFFSGNFQCEPAGHISSGTIQARLSTISDFSAICNITSTGIRCHVK